MTSCQHVNNYYPFGMVTPGRSFAAGSGYRFGFNGKESDSETYGGGNIYDYGFRIYNPRLGKFLSVDPLSTDYPWFTPYQFAGNKPVAFIDKDGLEPAFPGTELQFAKAPIIGNSSLGMQNWFYSSHLGGWQLTCVDQLIDVKPNYDETFELGIFFLNTRFLGSGTYTLYKLENDPDYSGHARYWETDDLIKNELSAEVTASIKRKFGGTSAMLAGELTLHDFRGNSILKVLNDPDIIEDISVGEATYGVGIITIDVYGYKNGVLMYSYHVAGASMGTPALSPFGTPESSNDEPSETDENDEHGTPRISVSRGSWKERSNTMEGIQDSLNRATVVGARTRNPELRKETDAYKEEILEE